MNKKAKLLAVVVVIVAVLGAVGLVSSCGSEPEAGPVESSPVEGETATPPTGEVSYTVTVTINPEGVGRVMTLGPDQSVGPLEPEGYPAGTELTLIATSNSPLDYAFDGWSGDVSGADSSVTITMDSNKSVTVNFKETPADGETATPPTGEVRYTVTVTINPEGVGKVMTLGPDYSFGALEPEGYPAGTELILVAISNSPLDYVFDSWSGNVSGVDSKITITMDSNSGVTVNFKETGLELEEIWRYKIRM